MSKKQKILIISASVILVLISFVVYLVINNAKNVYEISDIEHYEENTFAHSELSPFFPENIPENAVAKYNFFNSYSDRDIYLELTFDSEAELIAFTDTVLSPIENFVHQRSNPYNDSYQEYFYTKRYTSMGDVHFNEIDIDGRTVLSNFHSMSVSYTEKTVVIVSIEGKFIDYTPKYMSYFEIPKDKYLLDRIIFENSDNSNME